MNVENSGFLASMVVILCAWPVEDKNKKKRGNASTAAKGGACLIVVEEVVLDLVEFEVE